MDMSSLIETEKKWIPTELSKENELRLTPNTKTGNANEWTLIMAGFIQGRDTEGICLKGVLQNKDRVDEFALMSSLNKKCSDNYKKGTLSSHDKSWRICSAKMIAPSEFWICLKQIE